jgi:hypothetical protein
MVEFDVTHPNHPEGAAAEAVKCLKRANIEARQARRLNGDKSSFEVQILFFMHLEAAIATLRSSGFDCRFPKIDEIKKRNPLR